MTKLIRIWCEYTIGQDSVVFSTKEKARQWLETNAVLADALDGDDETLDDMFGLGLVDYEEITLDPS